MDFHESRLMEIDDFRAGSRLRHYRQRNDLEDAVEQIRNLGDRRESWSVCSGACCGAAANSG
jgi:hypothetical protein